MTKQDIIQENALKSINPKVNRFSMDIGTGVGKTLLLLKHMSNVLHEYSLFLIVIPKKSLIKNWNDEVEKHNMKHLLPHIHFSTYRSLHKLLKIYDWVYLDECHNFKSLEHFRCIQSLSENTFAVTGSYISSNNFNYTKFTNLFPLIFTFKTTMSVKEEILNDYRIIIHKIPLSKTNRCNSYLAGFLPETQAYITVNSAVLKAEKNKNFKALESLRIIRMKMIQNANSKVYYAKKLSEKLNKKTIIFCESTDHANKISEYTYHSKNPDHKNQKALTDFENGDTKKLSCVGQLNEGINVPDLELSIILHSYANNIRSKQRIGRILRLGADTKRIGFVHIIVYQNTIDENWVKSALEDFDNNKIAIFPEDKTEIILKEANLL